jgi:hypothetical protein
VVQIQGPHVLRQLDPFLHRTFIVLLDVEVEGLRLVGLTAVLLVGAAFDLGIGGLTGSKVFSRRLKGELGETYMVL